MSNDTNGEAGANSGQELDESKLPKFNELDPNNLTPEQATELIKAGQTLLGQTKHWSGKAKTHEQKIAEMQTALDEAKKNPPKGNDPAPQPRAGDDEVSQRIGKLELSEEKRQFGHQHGLSPEETDRLFAYSQGMGLKPNDALKDEFFKTGLEASRKKANADHATPGPSRRAPVVEGKTLKEMTTDERRKNFEKIVGSKS